MLSGFAATDAEAQARVAALQQGLKEVGWLEGRNLSIDFRWGTGERDQMRAFARELIELKPAKAFPQDADLAAGDRNHHVRVEHHAHKCRDHQVDH
jgi:uncharacterized protein YPO0396